MPRRIRLNGMLIGGILFLIGIVGFYVAFPYLPGMFFSGDSSSKGPGRLWTEVLRERSITCLTGLWFAVFGATIGSFLNVVAYRMPMGLSFVAKPSRCPFCEVPIKFRHNVPIFGWLALRGRCHACRLPISFRYPLVEVIVGALFFLLFVGELASGGANLPEPMGKPGIMWNVLTPNGDLLGLYFFHAYLLGTLATIALIKFDRLRIPVRLVVFSIVLGVGCRALFPHLSIAPWWSPWPPPTLPTSQQLALGFAVDLSVGLLVGWAIEIVIESSRGRTADSGRSGSIATSVILAGFLGWQMVVPIIVLSALLHFFITLSGLLVHRSADVLWTASYLWTTTLAIVLWRHLPALNLPTHLSPPSHHWLWLVVALVVIFVTTRGDSHSDATLP